MKAEKEEKALKYPHAASLFNFCRRVLDHKYGGLRVIDQDVGQILGFDPADCSHWKKGKKNVRSIQAVRSIADRLGVDERLVVEVASGDLSDTEAFYEYSGYGAFDLDPKDVELARKDYYRRNGGQWHADAEASLTKILKPDVGGIHAKVQEIHTKIGFEEPPLYLQEVVAAYPALKLAPLPDAEASSSEAFDRILGASENQVLTIGYPQGRENRPYVRYRIARAMADYFLADRTKEGKAGERDWNALVDRLREVEANVFVAELLTPERLLRAEMRQVDMAKDVVAQLAEAFWVSKSFMNRRLREILT